MIRWPASIFMDISNSWINEIAVMCMPGLLFIIIGMFIIYNSFRKTTFIMLQKNEKTELKKSRIEMCPNEHLFSSILSPSAGLQIHFLYLCHLLVWRKNQSHTTSGALHASAGCPGTRWHVNWDLTNDLWSGVHHLSSSRLPTTTQLWSSAICPVPATGNKPWGMRTKARPS